MKPKLSVVFIVALFCAVSVQAQYRMHFDFTAVAPSGQTLFYNIFAGSVQVINPYGLEGYGGENYVTGDLVIPDSVDYIFDVPKDSVIIDSVCVYSHADSVCVYNRHSESRLDEGEDEYVWYDTICHDTIWYDTVTYSHDTIVYYLDTITYAVTCIYYSAFRYCDSLTSVVIPNTVRVIRHAAFGGCTRLASITIGDSVEFIDTWVFSGCFAAGSVDVPASATSIGTGAFNAIRHINYYGDASGAPWGAISMNGVVEGDFVYSNSTKNYLMAYIGEGGDVTIPATVDTIGSGAFYVCNQLTSVTIPEGVVSIGDNAFQYCDNLSVVYMEPCVPPMLGTKCFDDNADDRTIVVPFCLYNDYYESFGDYINYLQRDAGLPSSDSDDAQGHSSCGMNDNGTCMQGIADVELSDFRVYSENGRIHVIIDGENVYDIHVYDVMGRTIARITGSGYSETLPAGIYMVRIGTLPAKKVVVLR